MAEALYFAPFDVADRATVGQKWKRYISRFDNYVTAMDIESPSRRKAALLHFAGEDVHDIFDKQPALPNNAVNNALNDYEKCKKILSNYFNGEANPLFSVYQFRKLCQDQDETLQAFHTRLRTAASLCDFPDDRVEHEIKTQIVMGCASQRLRRKIMEERDLTLDQILSKGRTFEQTEAETRAMETATEQQLNALRLSNQGSKKKKNRDPFKQKQGHHHNGKRDNRTGQDGQKICGLCGGDYPHQGGPTSCPASGRTCAKCRKVGHFARMCRSRDQVAPQRRHPGGQPQQKHQGKPPRRGGRANLVDEVPPEDSDTEYDYEPVFATGSVAALGSSKSPQTTVTVENTKIRMIIDTGANVNIIDRKTWNQLPETVSLDRVEIKIRPYNAPPLTIAGKLVATLTANGRTISDTIYVAEGASGNLLSRSAAEELGLVQFHASVNSTTAASILDQYPNLTDGIGLLQDYKVHLFVDPDVPPVANQRRIPINLRDQVEQKLKQLEQDDIIESVGDEPTPWVSPLVIVPKTNDIRICVDMRAPNRAIQRTRHHVPTFDEVISELCKSSVFSKIDLSSGYHQLLLDEQSRSITTFATHCGLKRYKRLNFGINCASELFQEAIRQVIQDIPNVINVSDDILVHTKDTASHHKTLHQLLQRLSDRGLTVNKDKCQLFQSTLTYLGHRISSGGVSPDPDKLEAIRRAAPPTSVTAVRSFMGLVNFCGRFVPHLADISKPLHDLTKKNAQFYWDSRHEKAFNQIKDALTAQKALAFYDPNRTTEVIVDASPVGVSALLTQVDKSGRTYAIAYASRALSPTEQRYSQIERECLAILFGCSKFRLYLLGSKFIVKTDHKPLLPIFSNSRLQPSARIERMMMKLQCFDLTLEYQEGKTNPADFMSRHPVQGPTSCTETERYLNFVITTRIPEAMTLERIETASLADQTTCKVIEALQKSRWSSDSDLAPYHKIRNQLSTNGKVLLKGTKIVLPHGLREEAFAIAHEGHQGVVKTKALMRTKVWFPGIDDLIASKISSCVACQATSKLPPPPPVQVRTLPDAPWQRLSIDFYGPVKSEYLMVLVDDHSRYPVVEVLSSTSADVVIPRLDQIFTTFGIPEILRSDNGPPFNSAKFASFARYLGFKHHRVAPRWARANGEAERFMQNLKKTIQTAIIDRRSYKQAINTFLRSYRATPHASTNVSPHQALFGRAPRTRLPTEHIVDKSTSLHIHDRKARLRMQQSADKRAHRAVTLKIGDTVLVKNDTRGKFTPTFHPVAAKIVAMKGTKVTVLREGCRITRNVSALKQVPPHFGTSSTAKTPPTAPVRVHAPTTATPILVLPKPAGPRRNPPRARNPPAHLAGYQR